MSPETRDFAEKALNDLSEEMLKMAEECRDDARKDEGISERRVLAGLGMLAGGLALVADILAHNPPIKP